jgi:acyl carrier protein
MTDPELRETLLRIARQSTGLEQIPAGDLAEALDSVQRLTLVVAIEDHLKISFSPEDDEEIRSFEDLLARVHRLLEARDA